MYSFISSRNKAVTAIMSKWTRHFYTEDLIPFLPFEVAVLDFDIGLKKNYIYIGQKEYSVKPKKSTNSCTKKKVWEIFLKT